MVIGFPFLVTKFPFIVINHLILRWLNGKAAKEPRNVGSNEREKANEEGMNWKERFSLKFTKHT